jgi:pimeloyl-ACP methyl ester carboxylesterase
MQKDKKHIVIFSHGFGTRKDDRGLLTDIADGFKETQSMLFDYNGINEAENILTVRLLSEQAKMLNDVIEKARLENEDAIIDIIGHSQGCLVIGLAKPTGIHKTIFIAPSLDNDIEHTLNMFQGRPGTEINLSGVSKLSRKDGTITLVPSEFWTERKKFDPVPLYNELSYNTDLTIINAKQDEIIDTANTKNLDKRIKILTIDGNHQFSGESRETLISKIKKII